MSVIGRIGQFLIDYQETIGAVLFVLVIIALVFLLVRLIVKNAKRKKAEEAERNKLIEELLKVSQDNKEILAALAKVSAIDNKVEELTVKQGALNEELVRQLEAAAGGTVEEVITKAVQAAREADEACKEKVKEPAPIVEEKPAVDAMEEELQSQVAEQIREELHQQFEGDVEPAVERVVEEPEVEQVEEPEVEQVAVEPAIERVVEQPARAYTSREAGVDKHGNVYTESMLMEQIG